MSTQNNTQYAVQRFSCVGCGSCCQGRLVPLTLSETRMWLRQGHSVAILLEAFDESSWPPNAPEFEYNKKRSATVKCGNSTLHVVAIFAANAIPHCPNLGPDNLCSIYSDRPLVCRIYPMEISPFIPLSPISKDCPPESWEQGALLASDKSLRTQILQSQQADRDDARLKVTLCEALGMTVTAWKGSGFTIYFPPVETMQNAIDSLGNKESYQAEWKIKSEDPSLTQKLCEGLYIQDTEINPAYIYHETKVNHP